MSLPFPTRPESLNFPLNFQTSIRHVLAPFDQLWLKALESKRQGKQEFDVSPKLRVGPLSFEVNTLLHSHEGDPVLDFSLGVLNMASGFPWGGLVKSQLRILNAKGRVVVSEPRRKPFQVGTDLPGTDYTTCTHSHCTIQKLEDLVDDNALYLEVLLEVQGKLKPGLGGENWQIPNAVLEAPTLGQGNLAMTPDSRWADVEIASRDGDKFPAHRVVLAGRSRVFETMFETEMMERAEGAVKIGDMGSKAVKIMINFIYGGEFRKEIEDFEGHGMEVWLELVDAGERYEMPLLMTLAGMALMLRCTRQNAMELFCVLKKYGKAMQDVMVQLADFIKKNVDAMAVVKE